VSGIGGTSEQEGVEEGRQQHCLLTRTSMQGREHVVVQHSQDRLCACKVCTASC
jgi:hypothetical protein